VQEIDGHDLAAIDAAYAAAQAADRPAAIFARTKKGSGVAAVEDKENQHGKPLADPDAAIEELGGIRSLSVSVQSPPEPKPYAIEKAQVERPSYELGEKVATRGAYGDALAWIGSVDEKVVALDGEVGNSTYAERFAAKHPDRFFEMYIAEQQMVAAAIGMQTRGWKPFASSFGAFLSRAYDFVRMGAISDADLKLCGSHVGVSIGPDGPSQMALEDIASLRAVFGSVVLYPSDANQAVQLLDAMRAHRGISYMRTTREATPVIYEAGEAFEIGGSRTVRSSDGDAVTLVGAGITLRECLTAADELVGKGIAARVIDLYSVKPVDAEAVIEAARETGAIVTVEDHWAEGGIGEVVATVLADASVTTRLERLAVTERPGSGPPASLLAAAGIDAEHVVAAAERITNAR
jgi:transketolase